MRSCAFRALVGAAVLAVAACFSSLDGYSGGEEPTADGGAADGARLRCAVDRCTEEHPVCCAAARDGGAKYPTLQCRASGDCPDGVVIRCRGSDDCAAAGQPGAVCCAFRDSNSIMRSVECTAPSTCVGLHAILCDRQAPACDGGQICAPVPTTVVDICQSP